MVRQGNHWMTKIYLQTPVQASLMHLTVRLAVLKYDVKQAMRNQNIFDLHAA